MVARQSRGKALHDAIIIAAQQEFEQYGYDGARIQGIADRAGISKPNLIYYFPNKLDLYKEVLSIAIEHWAGIGLFDKQSNPRDAISKYIAAKVAFSAQHPQSARIFTNEVLAGLPHIKEHIETKTADWFAQQIAVLDGWKAEGKIRDVDSEHIIIAIWGMTQHLADYQAQLEALKGEKLSEGDYQRYQHSFSEIILNALLP